MRLPLAVTVLVAAMASFPAAAAARVGLLASDDRGVTLELALPAFDLSLPGPDGRSELRATGLDVMDVPGRPLLPFAGALIALPPGARAAVRVLEAGPEEVRRDARLRLAGRPSFREDASFQGLVPAREVVPAILDGSWPRTAVELGEPFTLRRQRLVALRLMPFRYDEATGTLWARRSMKVRVDFTGPPGAPAAGAPAEDRHWEPVLRNAVLNYEQARSWRAAPRPARRLDLRGAADPGGLLGAPGAAGPARAAAFDEDFPEVRVLVDSTGLYQLRYADLAPHGYPAGIPIGQVSVHRHEFVEGQSPPYVTIELPIEVEDRNANGVFDGADRIVVFVQAWAERSRASKPQRAWGEGEVVYATAVSGQGLRMASRPGWRNVTGLTPLASYPWRQRWEKNLTYFLFPVDTLHDQFHWTEITLYYERPDSFRFQTNHLDTTRAVTFAVTWEGRRDGSHFSWAQIRQGSSPFLTVADSLQWFGRTTRTATVTLPGSAFGEGDVNRLRVWGKGSSQPPDPATNNSDNVGLDHYEATYWRRFRALFNYLSCNTGDAAGEVQVVAGGFTTDQPRVYDVTDSLAPLRLTVDPARVQPVGAEFQVEFQDSVAAGVPRRYVVTTTPRVLPASRFSAVVRRQLTSRLRGDYLMIVPEAFLGAVAPLVGLRQAQGLDVVLAPFEAVCDEFNGGRKSDHAIKRFVRHAYESWSARFVLLVGDGSEDPRNFLAFSSRDWIPIHKISGPVGIPLPGLFGYEIVPSDPWYVCMENCDLSGSTPVLQDLFIGRLPVGSAQQLQDLVAKLVAYESFSSDQTWRRHLLLLADDDFSGATFFGGGGGGIRYCQRPGETVFREINHTVAGIVLNAAGLREAVVDTFNLETYLVGVACDNDDCTCKRMDAVQQFTHASVTPELISRLNAGRLWWNYQGHANEFVLAHEDIYVNRGFQDDKDLLLNDAKPFLFSAFSCHANAFARHEDNTPNRGPSLGEEMVTLPGRGAIGSWASSGYEILPSSGSSHINVTWARALFENPPHDEYLGDRGARVVLGETIALALLQYVPTVAFNNTEKGIALTYHLLGDPATRLSIGAPQAAVTANALPVVHQQPVRLHTAGDTLRLEADLVSTVMLTALALERTDAAGTATVPESSYTVTPAFPDTSAGGSGGRRYHLSYGTTLRPESHRYTFRTRDRYGLEGAFDVVFEFLTQLLLDGRPIADNDPVPPTADLSLRVFSPAPLDPAADLTLRVNSDLQPFAFAPLPGDASGREWLLSWSHAPYPIDRYEVRLEVAGAGAHTRTFRVEVGANQLRVENPVAFPNPFDDDGGTSFSFLLVSGGPSDVHIAVYAPSGRLLYRRLEKGLAPGYHQLAWDGRDAEGDPLANGVYVYRLVASYAGSKSEHLGRLVKLRKPRRGASP
jgi:hypothetical protein